MFDQVKAEVRASGMDYEDFKKMPADPWQAYMAAIIFIPVIAIAAYWAFNGLLSFFRSQYATPTMAAYIVLPLIAFFTAAVAYFLREVVKTLIYPVIEVGVGLAAVAQAVSPQAGDLARLVAVLAGIRIIVDGFTRFFKFLHEAAPKAEQIKSQSSLSK